MALLVSLMAVAQRPLTVAAQAAPAFASNAPQTTSEAWTGVIANYDDQDVTTFNTSTDQTQTIQLPENELPQQVAISPDGKTAYVTSTVTYASVQPIDLTTNPATPKTPIDLANGATAIAITPNGSTLLVVDDQDSVVGINTTTDVAGTPIPIQGTVADVVVTPDGSTAWALSNTHSEVYLTPISLSTYQAGTPINVATIQSHPTSIALSPDGRTAYLPSSAVAGSGYGAELSAIDLGTGAETDTYLSYLINAIGQIVISPNGQSAYISGSGGTGNSSLLVDVVDLTQNPPHDSTAVVVDDKPYSMAISPDGSEVYVASYHSNLVQVIDTSDNQVESQTIPTGDGPQGIAITPDQAPVASLHVTPGNAGSPTTFDASASTVPYGSIVNYAWDFGDTQTDDTTTPTDTHTYSTPGSYTATVTETSSGGTSTTQTFTGHTVSNNGGPQAAASATFTVGGLPTTTTLTSSVNPSAIGQSVTLTATVAGSSGLGPPTGSVTFMDGSTAIDTETLSRDGLDGRATYTTSSLSVGTHPLTAVYASTPNFSGSTSAVLNQVVNPLGSTTVTVAPVSTTYGGTVTYSATVTGVGATPTGTVNFTTGTTQLCTATLSGGTGSCTADSAPVGQDTVTGTYSGDGNYGSSSNTASLHVVPAPTTTTVTSSANPSTFGGSVTFTATVSAVSGVGTPTGTVTFEDGGTAIGTGSLSVAGGVDQATLTTSSLTAGRHAIVAVYGGDSNFIDSSSSPALEQVVQMAGATTTVTVTPTSTTFGAGVTYQATVSGPGGTPTGTVTFSVGTTKLCTATLSGGAAKCTADKAPVGQDTVTGAYSGDGNYSGSSGTAALTVAQASTTTDVSAAPDPSSLGQTVTITAIVSGSTPVATPGGTVTFKDGPATLGTGTLSVVDGEDEATLTTSSLSVGQHSITAIYGGDGNFGGSTSTALNQVVTPAASTTTVSVTPSSSTLGESVTYRATVSGAGGTPTGTVTFTAGTTQLCTATLSGGGGSCTADTAPVGADTVTGRYSGDPTHAGSSGTATLTVGRATSTTSLVSSANPSTFGESVTLTATVTAATGVATPGGTVTFKDGSATLGTGTLSQAGGQDQATFTTSSLPVGQHSITAIYDGDGNFDSSTSPALSQLVNQASTTTTVSVMPTTITFGNRAVYRVTVSGPGGTPTGTVAFGVGTARLCTAKLSGGSGACLSSNAPAGQDTVTGEYSGDATYLGSSGTAPLTVVVGGSNTGVTTSVSPSSFGQSVSFTATVTAPQGVPTGTVTFEDGTTVIGSSPVTSQPTSTTGQATFSTAILSVGSHPIIAVYSGDANVSGSSGSVSQVVQRATTTTTLTASSTSITTGQAVTLTATVSDPPGVPGPSGTVTFEESTGAVLGTVAVANGGATFTVSALPTGTYSLVAVYNGDPNYAGSTSSPLQLFVIQPGQPGFPNTGATSRNGGQPSGEVAGGRGGS
ncbi:MAG: Ig-like domain repeat protein [Candidatus Dormiibacterota bacterium]